MLSVVILEKKKDSSELVYICENNGKCKRFMSKDLERLKAPHTVTPKYVKMRNISAFAFL
jgi:hypothetical protein